MQTENLLMENLMETSDEIFFHKGKAESLLLSFSNNKKHNKQKTMTDCVKYFTAMYDIDNTLSGLCTGYEKFAFNDELSGKKVRYIAQELASALDKNSVSYIKKIKQKYGNDEEFLSAKKFIDQKCKEIWNVFDSKNTVLHIPKEAMKALGITNQPKLEFMLGNSIRYYEKDCDYSTAIIISSILENKNMTYTMEDIHKFLKNTARKENLKYNTKTVSYLITEQTYNRSKLKDLGVTGDMINLVLKTLPFKIRMLYFLRSNSYLKKFFN